MLTAVMSGTILETGDKAMTRADTKLCHHRARILTGRDQPYIHRQIHNLNDKLSFMLPISQSSSLLRVTISQSSGPRLLLL